MLVERRDSFEQPADIPVLDHLRPMAIREALPAQAVGQHALDLRQGGSPDKLLIRQHPGRFFGLVVVIQPAFPGSFPVERLHHGIVFRPGQLNDPILLPAPAIPAQYRLESLAVQPRQECDQRLHFIRSGQPGFHLKQWFSTPHPPT